jgi:hypothetical protein
MLSQPEEAVRRRDAAAQDDMDGSSTCPRLQEQHFGLDSI